MTAEDFGLAYAGRHVEYVNGEVREVPIAGGRHGKVCVRVDFYLTLHGDNAGHIFGNDTFLKVATPNDPERVYSPDVFFVSFERLARDAEVPVSTVAVVPNLVFEVRSPSDTWTAVIAKVVDYLNAGVSVVVLLDPESKTASVCGNDFWQRVYGPADTLTLPEVLPRFAVVVRKFFE